MVGIVGLRVEVVVPVLIVDREDKAQFVAASGQPLHSLPASGLGAGRQDVRVQVVVAAKAPAVQVDVGAVDSFRGQLPKLSGSLVERDELVVLRRVVLVVVMRLRLDVGEDAVCTTGDPMSLPTSGLRAIFSWSETKWPVSRTYLR